MRKYITILFVLLSVAAFAQTTPTFNNIKLQGDSVTGLSDGRIWYNAASDKFRARVNGATVTLYPQGGSSVTPAALTKTNDTNVTLTLGGTPSTALLQATSLTLGWTGTLSKARGGTGNANGPPLVYSFAFSDESTPITSGTNKITFRMPYAMTVTNIYCELTTAQASGSIFTIDINEAGSSILSTKITIDNTEDDSSTAVAAPVISDTALALRAKMTLDVDQVGDGTGVGGKCHIIGY